MWILPNNHPLSSVFVREYVVSKEDLNEFFEKSEPVLMWKSKPLSWKTFLRQWKRVWWLQHLSGRILKPSIQNHFETELTESLEVIRANHSLLPEPDKELMIRDTYGPSFESTSELSDRDGVSLKTLQDTLLSGSISSKENWKKWVTSLRQEYTRRKKSAHLTGENGCSSSPLKWTTVVATDFNRNTKYAQGGTALSMQVKNWSTPRVGGMEGYETRLARGKDAGLPGEVQYHDQQKNWPTPQSRDFRSPDLPESGNYQRKEEKGWTIDLNSKVLNWPTPTTMDQLPPKTNKAILKEVEETRPGRSSFSNLRDAAVYGEMKNWPTPDCSDRRSDKSKQQGLSNAARNWPTPVSHETRLGYQDRDNGKKGSQESLTTTVLNTDFPQVKEHISTHGKSPARLNPAWSIQLMGTTLQKIFTVPLAIPLLNKQQNSLSETSGEKLLNGTTSLSEDEEWDNWINS